MAFSNIRRTAIVLIVAAIASVYAQKHAASIASMSVPEIEEQLQVRFPARCSPVSLLHLLHLLTEAGMRHCAES